MKSMNFTLAKAQYIKPLYSKSFFDFHADITLDHLTVVPLTLSTVQLEWQVVPTDGHHCITGYNIRVSGQNESQIMGADNSFLLCGVQLEPSKVYTYSVTANISSTQTGPSVEQTSIVEVQGMFLQHTSVCSIAPSSSLRLFPSSYFSQYYRI